MSMTSILASSLVEVRARIAGRKAITFEVELEATRWTVIWMIIAMDCMPIQEESLYLLTFARMTISRQERTKHWFQTRTERRWKSVSKLFVLSNSESQNRVLKTSGLHSNNLDEGDVFWEPGGDSLLAGLEFVRSRWFSG